MFENTIDKKKMITDKNGNEIVDLTTSIFGHNVTGMSDYNMVRLSKTYQMRADKVSFAEYGNIEETEFILKYSGISNPFSLDKDDVLLIPNIQQAKAQMVDLEDEEKKDKTAQIRNYFKFTNKDFKSNSDSYDKFANKEIPSGIKSATPNADYIVPYISDDGTAAITVRGGRVYFGEDNATAASNVVQAVIDSAASAIADQCAINGLTLADFVRASRKNQGYDE